MNRPEIKSGCLASLLPLLPWLLLLGCVPPLTPVPLPDPVNPPVIVVVPAVEGRRVVLLLHETRDQTPAFAALVTALRTGTNETYFATKGHSVYVLDIDSKGADGKPLDVLTRLAPTMAGKVLPVLVVAEQATGGKLGKVLSCESLKSAAVDEVMAAIKKSGG